MAALPSGYIVPAERLKFWASQSSRDWFEAHGYTLYQLMDEGETKHKYAVPTREEPEGEPDLSTYFLSQIRPKDPFPYAYMGPGDISDYVEHYNHPPYSTVDDLTGRIMFAQDTKGRHVAIKMVQGGSEEYKVLRLLKDQPRLSDPDTFPSVIPVIDLLPYDDHWFLIMPRWERSLNFRHRFFNTFHSAFQHLISLLEGLVFLHELRICHRDLYARNILINHFSSLSALRSQSSGHRHYLVSCDLVRYAIMDFDMAMLLDEKTYGPNPRRPTQEVFCGIGSAPYELVYAHLDFDPFKYDVACLGIYIFEHYQHIIEDVPLLAPLISSMVTPHVDKRFTAVEALAFTKTILPTISSLERIGNKRDHRWCFYYERDVWAGLPDSFVQQWNTDPYTVSSWSSRKMHWLFYETARGWYLTYYCRYALHILTYVPRLLLRPFLRGFGLP